MKHSEFLRRTELMLGSAVMDALSKTRVAIFGLGGVGSWCAEALVRSGVGHLLLIDADRIAITNINRQLMATTTSVGQIKIEALAERLKAINPTVELDLRPCVYDAAHAADFALDTFDYVIDAIDSLSDKAALIRHALSIPSITLFSSMGAALKMDPFQIRASEFRKIAGDGLARALRTKFKKTGGFPSRKFTCVWSPEHRENKGDAALGTSEGSFFKARINGTVVHTTAAFGLALAGLVISSVEANTPEKIQD